MSKERCARWIMELQQYNFEVKHRSGKTNQNADALSRNLQKDDYTEQLVCYMENREELEFDPLNLEGIVIEFLDEDLWNKDDGENLWDNKEVDNYNEKQDECIIREEWLIAGQYCCPCQER